MSAPRKLAASALVMTLAAIPVANAATGASAPRTLQTRQLEGALAAWRTSDPATVAALALQHGRRAKHVVVMQSHGAITVRGRLLAGARQTLQASQSIQQFAQAYQRAIVSVLMPTSSWTLQAVAPNRTSQAIVVPAGSAPAPSVRLAQLWSTRAALQLLVRGLTNARINGFGASALMPGGRLDLAMMPAVMRPDDAGGIATGIVDTLVGLGEAVGCIAVPEECAAELGIGDSLMALADLAGGSQNTGDSQFHCMVHASPFTDVTNSFLADIADVECPLLLPAPTTLSVSAQLQNESTGETDNGGPVSCDGSRACSTDAYTHNASGGTLWDLKAGYACTGGVDSGCAVTHSGSDSTLFVAG